MIEEGLLFVTRAVGELLRPTPERIQAIQVTGAVRQIARVKVSLPGQLPVGGRVMIEAEAAFRQVPSIMGRSAIRLWKIVIELVRAVNSIIRVFADLSAV